MSNPHPQTLIGMADASFAKHADKLAYTCMKQRLTFGQLDTLTENFAGFLQSIPGLEKGDRVAVQLPNLSQYPVAALGVIRAGMVLVNTNPLYTPRELKHQLTDSGAKAVVLLDDLKAAAMEILPETDVSTVIMTYGADVMKLGPMADGQAYAEAADVPRQVDFMDALARGAGNFTPVSAEPEDLAVLQYTGGTTGVAKGAMLTNFSITSNVKQFVDLMGPEGLVEGGEVYVAPLPLYHIYSFTLNCMSMLATGNHNILIPNPRDPDAVVAAMSGEPFTGFNGLTTLFAGLMMHEGFRNLDFSHLKFTGSGGMALVTEVGRKWRELTGVQISEGYGMAEASPVVTFAGFGKIQDGTVGSAVPDTELRVVSENGDVMPAREPGELQVRGPQVMKGYWNRPEATAETISADGWLSTGDVATIAEDGYVRIVDRKKDMIIVSGFNVYPKEVEDVAAQCPGVAMAAAIGVPDEKSGEAVKLFVVRTDEAVTDEDVIAFSRQHLAGYKVPKIVEFRDALPMTNVGKILRRELR